ncbi:MAG: MMPL family transporter [SAR324 cluster bacterium]|nr:MMPL family transporter [SAR324 cluster bacterium]
MNKIRHSIDQAFLNWAKLVINNKWVFAVLILVLSVLLISQIRNLKIDTSTEGFFHPEDPSLITYNAFRDQFGRDEMIILMIESDHLFSIDFLTRLKEMHQELEDTVPNLNDINDLVSARKTIGNEGSLIVGDLLEELPQSDEELAELKAYVLQNKLYKNFLISEDGRHTVIAIQTSAWSSQGQPEFGGALDTGTRMNLSPEKPKPLSDKENSEIIARIHEIKVKYESPDFKISFTGTPVVTDYLKRSMMKDMRFFTLLAIAGIAVFLFIMFRRVTGVILPLLTVILSFLYTLGLMALTHTALKLPTQILPSFLLATSIGSSVHMMSMFYRDYHMDKGNKNQAIMDAMAHSALPVAMTSLTTAASLLSFATAAIAPIADLGMFAAFGVMVSLFLTLTFLPCFLAILPVQHHAHQDAEELPLTVRFLEAVGDFAHDHYKLSIIVWAVILVGAMTGLPKLRLEHNTLIWFPETSEIRQQTQAMDDIMKGSVSIEMIVDTKKENGLYDPKVLNALNELEEYALTLAPTQREAPFVGKALSLASMLKEINQALGENKHENYVIPQNRQLIAQEFLLFENSGSDDLKDIVDSQFSKTRLTIKTPWIEARSYMPILEALENKAHELLGPEVEIQTTGMIELFAKTVNIMMKSMITSYLIAAVVITLMMIVLIGRFGLGLLSMIPNLSPIVITLGMMGLVGIPLDMFTLLIGSIAIGLAVDDTIHFFHNYMRYLNQYGDSKKAIEETLGTAGMAMLVTSTVLTLGFWVYMLASMNNLFNFGLLTGLALLIAFLADVNLSPALLTWVDEAGKKKR